MVVHRAAESDVGAVTFGVISMVTPKHVALVGSLCLVMLVSLTVVPMAAADSHTEAADSYRIIQGDQQITVEPIEGDEPVEAFYDYRNPEVGDREHPYWGRSFSSEGTVEYQQDDVSILMLYDGPEGVSLVAVHDRYHDTQADGTTGGSASWEISGLPEDGEWAVIDDDYGWLTDEEDKDDIFYFDADHTAGAADTDGEPPTDVDAMMSWVWLTGRTDGVAFRGLGTDPEITIEPAFNEASYHRYGDQRRADEPPDRPGMGERYNGSIDDWQVIVPTDDGFDRVSLNSLDEPVEIRPGPADNTAAQGPAVAVESVALDSTRIETGETARLTATLENTGDRDGEYTAEFRIGNSKLQTETVTVRAGEQRTVEFDQRFTARGVYELAVNGETVTLSVEDPESTADSTGATVDSSGSSADNTESATAGQQSDESESNEDGDSENQLPGSGPLTLVVALVVVGVVGWIVVNS